MDTLQFYPTPASLAIKAWSLFQDRSFRRVLDPSAGDGALLGACPRDLRSAHLDAIEIDGSKHATLRGKGMRVVGLDFEQFLGCEGYTHVIMNPPFSKGCEHVLHAWDGLFDGEIVAIINAQTLRNPFSKARQHLASLIESHGHVQFIEDAFWNEETRRKTEVEIALVYLRKSAEASSIVGDLIGKLKKDEFAPTDVAASLPLAIPENFVENAVLMFRAALQAITEEAHAKVRAAHYSAMLGPSLFESASRGESLVDGKAPPANSVRTLVADGYEALKAKAWSHILRSTQVQSKLSTKTRQRLHMEFETIRQLEFTVANIYGFLEGLCRSGAELQLEMACEVFDLVTRYHSENCVHYMGWKSNDRHRECGMRMRTTRFVLPGHGTDSYQRSLNHNSIRALSDIDRVFAMLDGKLSPELSLVTLFERHWEALCSGQRVDCTYFSIRYYRLRGTIHFFARDKALVDRLNRLVGQHRRWLPPDTATASKGFWQQYDQAEKLDAQVRSAFEQARVGTHGRHSIDDAFSRHAEYRDPAQQRLSQAIDSVLEANGIEIGPMIEHSPVQCIEA